MLCIGICIGVSVMQVWIKSATWVGQTRLCWWVRIVVSVPNYMWANLNPNLTPVRKGWLRSDQDPKIPALACLLLHHMVWDFTKLCVIVHMICIIQQHRQCLHTSYRSKKKCLHTIQVRHPDKILGTRSPTLNPTRIWSELQSLVPVQSKSEQAQIEFQF